MNKYTISRLLRETIKQSRDKFNLDDEAFKVMVTLDQHVADRINDRNLAVGRIQHLLTQLIKKCICQLIYFNAIGENKFLVRDDLGYCVGLTVTCINATCYNIKLRTVFHRNEKQAAGTILINV